MYQRWIVVLAICLFSFSAQPATSDPFPKVAFALNQTVTVSGELKQWHPVTLEIQGPTVAETDLVNPFFDYRVEATFSHNGTDYVVPAYFAGDGDAANSSASSGNIWYAHFSPQSTGFWTYSVDFVRGTDIAIDESATITETILSGVSGSFTIAGSDKTGKDLKGRGALRNTGASYLQFDNNDWYIKGGTDSPENILAYTEFDGTYSLDEINFVKDFDPHVQDWRLATLPGKRIKAKG